MSRHARLVSTGRFLPPVEVSNDTLRRRFSGKFPDFVEKMEQSSGIRRRWYAPEGMTTSDVSAEAAREAIARAGIKAEDLDLVILGTDSPDFITPATSVVLQHKIGARNAGTFDVGCACASFPTGLATAHGLMASNPHINRVLVVGAYMMERLADPDDPMIFFYGDGAGAAVLTADTSPGMLGAAFQADGAYNHHWGIFAGAVAEPATEAAVREGRTKVRMLERYPPEINHEGWPRLVRKLACTTGFAVSDIDFIIFTQVRKPSIELVMADLGLPMERTHTVMEEWGYTGSACIPMALDDALEKKMIPAGSLVVLVGSGVGYNQAAVALRM
ncbi:MAG: 3-oxoacyl-ACP synthase [Acidobacteria bacterium RIFCSPLOWO2_02_FULL_67_36]|nr:MAG: 3-oxoacyl-ACP synthase [Acidobacteria bacterium RIFCSPLOWO2_02_FULL_67_36]